MFDNVFIQNFRCYDEVILSNLRRINIIVGENGSGKTTLGEALFMAAAGGPSAAFWGAQYSFAYNADATDFLGSDFRRIFLERPFSRIFDQTWEIRVRFNDSLLGTYLLRVFLDSRSNAKATLDLLSTGPLSTAPPVVFEKTQEPDGFPVSVRVVTNNKGVPDVEGIRYQHSTLYYVPLNLSLQCSAVFTMVFRSKLRLNENQKYWTPLRTNSTISLTFPCFLMLARLHCLLLFVEWVLLACRLLCIRMVQVSI